MVAGVQQCRVVVGLQPLRCRRCGAPARRQSSRGHHKDAAVGSRHAPGAPVPFAITQGAGQVSVARPLLAIACPLLHHPLISFSSRTPPAETKSSATLISGGWLLPGACLLGCLSLNPGWRWRVSDPAIWHSCLACEPCPQDTRGPLRWMHRTWCVARVCSLICNTGPC